MDSKQSALYYEIRYPKTPIENPPLLILLHGYGSNEMDLFSFADELPDELLIISARAPMSLGYHSYSWYTINFDQINGKSSNIAEAKEACKTIASFIDEMTEKLHQERSVLSVAVEKLNGWSVVIDIFHGVTHPIAVSVRNAVFTIWPLHLQRAFWPSGEYYFTWTKVAHNYDSVNWLLLTVSTTTLFSATHSK